MRTHTFSRAASLPLVLLLAGQCSNEAARGGRTGGGTGGSETETGGAGGGGTPTGGNKGSSVGGSGGEGGSSTGGAGGGATGGAGDTGGSGGGTGGSTPADAGPKDAKPPSPDTGGGGGEGGSGGPVTVDSFACVKNSFGECFKDSWMMFGCFSQSAQDCITNSGGSCPNQNASLPMEEQGLTSDEFFSVGGTPGQMYKVSITVNGVTEGKYYEKGMRAAGNATPANINGADGIDGFYTGGNPVDQENYNIYKIAVRNPPTNPSMPKSGTEVAHYYLNSMPSQFTNGEAHNTFAFHFSHDIVVPGGGVIQYHTADRNCHAVDNCGPGSHNSGCAVGDGRTIPGEPSLKIPATYMGKPVSGLNTRNGANQPFHAQIFHVTVTAVTPM